MTVLDSNQCIRQADRHIIELQQYPVFVVRRVEAAHQHGIKTGKAGFSTGLAIAQPGNTAACEAQAQVLRRLTAIPEIERPGEQVEFVGVP